MLLKYPFMVTQNHFVIPVPILEKFMFPQEGCQTGPVSTVSCLSFYCQLFTAFRVTVGYSDTFANPEGVTVTADHCNL